MNQFLIEVLVSLNLYILIFSRLIGLFVVAPIFGRNNLPNIFKLGFCLIIAYIILPYVEGSGVTQLSFFETIFLAIKELLIGLVIGFIAYIIFSIFFIAGSFIDMDLGFGMASVMDPQYGAQVPITGNFIYTIGTVVFMILNGHHHLIRSLVNSFYIFPVNSLISINNNLFIFLVKLLDYIFTSAIKIAIPVMIAIFLTNLILGILARTMPQMNVFVVGMPLKLIIGILIISIVFPYYISIMKDMFNSIYEFIHKIIRIF
ncbi:flagellar biosynthetic protein FliR [Alkalithermobacter paradoxus]|uniref:Flagellar biosynthetic protein FliR n=1 Tax=Alkalithermobacter paradoxus TaxID=29349 RepID=A0A1V4IB07_9FIRM|nr:flagellar biosynthetic protein FliR [[Clostridium] thermoalcaliphilum]